MRIDCPHCGLRSIEEFTIRSEVKPERPGEDATDALAIALTHASTMRMRTMAVR